MQIEKMFEDAVREGLFADFDICVRGPLEMNISGGRHVSKGAKMFDVASLTKALTHLTLWKLFVLGRISPLDRIDKFLSIPNAGNRQLWHFMSYVAKEYAFDYEKLRRGEADSLKGTLLSEGFGDWNMKFKYENYSSIFLGMMLENFFGTGLEDIFHSQLCHNGDSGRLLFHPVQRGMDSRLTVPTSQDVSRRGITHDPCASAYSAEEVSIAGVFSDAQTIADIFHRNLEPIIASGFYDVAAQNQLEGVDDTAPAWGLGFDIPVPARNLGSVEGPLVFGGFTGCRIFFTKNPRLTVCILTNRTFFGHSKESLDKFSAFSWNVIREILQRTR